MSQSVGLLFSPLCEGGAVCINSAFCMCALCAFDSAAGSARGTFGKDRINVTRRNKWLVSLAFNVFVETQFITNSGFICLKNKNS